MADRWVIAYDVDVAAVNVARGLGGVTLMTVYNHTEPRCMPTKSSSWSRA